MARCEDCIHEIVCVIRAFPDAFKCTKWDKEPCDHFKAADVEPTVSETEQVPSERCPDCKHFVGCETACGGRVCDQYEESAGETIQEQEADTDDVVRCKDCFYNKNGSCMMSEKLDKENYDPNYSCGRGYRE